MSFQDLFHSDNAARDKFLSRLFGIFSEEIVRCWAAATQAPYKDLGRPVLKAPSSESRGFALDFTFRHKVNHQIYVVEMKCELEYENYRYMVLEAPWQLQHHKNDAFKYFLAVAKNSDSYAVRVKGNPQPVDGAILIWGSYTEAGYQSVSEHYGFADILSIENIIADLISWRDQRFADLIDRYSQWSRELFEGLLFSECHICGRA